MSGPSVRIVLQARLGSTRLPAKSLLPVAGVPLAALAALRASNTGIDTVAAVPSDSTEDLLAEVLAAHGVRVTRGPLHDVLARYALATADLADDAVVVRVTGDNCFPDGGFIAEMISALGASDSEYVSWDWPDSGLPYGLAAEAFRVGLLRQAASEATDEYDREHVTPWMKRRFPDSRWAPRGWTGRFADLRCTVDGGADYQRVARVFSTVSNAREIGWPELVERLAAAEYASPRVSSRIVAGRPRSTMILGTVQLGMDYGRANTSGMPSASEAAELLFAAAASGIDTVDTARDYGLSELRIGDALMAGLAGSIDVVTKLDPLTALPEDASAREVRTAVDASVYRSCRDLRVRTLDTLLLHRWSLRRSHRGRVWDRLLELRAEGVVGSLGASVQSPPEALEALADVDVAHVQLPINVLDRRWVAAGVDDAARARPGVVVDARSVFLQGVLLLDSEKWPRVPGVDAAAIVRELDALVAQLDRSNRADLCVAFVKSLDWVDGLVVGVERTEQLLENVRQFGGAELDATERQLVLDRLPRVPDALLDPSQWDRGRE